MLQYHRTMPVPHLPPPTAPPDGAELDRLTNPDLAAGDAREHARLGQRYDDMWKCDQICRAGIKIKSACQDARH